MTRLSQMNFLQFFSFSWKTSAWQKKLKSGDKRFPKHTLIKRLNEELKRNRWSTLTTFTLFASSHLFAGSQQSTACHCANQHIGVCIFRSHDGFQSLMQLCYNTFLSNIAHISESLTARFSKLKCTPESNKYAYSKVTLNEFN